MKYGVYYKITSYGFMEIEADSTEEVIDKIGDLRADGNLTYDEDRFEISDIYKSF